MAINLNDLVPAPPAGSTNVKWQEDSSGNVSAYVTSPVGLPGVDLLTQGANISATNLVATPVAGLYRITAYIIVTRAGTTSTLPSVVITWTDKDNTTAQSFTLTPTNTGNSLTTFQQATMVVDSSAAVIQYATSGFATTGGTSMQYALHIRVEAI